MDLPPFETTEQQWALERVKLWWAKLREVHKLTDGTKVRMEPPKVIFNGGKCTAGLAYSKRHVVKLSDHFLHNESREAYDETIAHELAHVFANQYYKMDCKHGFYWKQTMRAIGLRPDIYHQYASTVRNKRRTPVKLTCQCGAVYGVSQSTLSKLKQGKKRANCIKCHQTIIIRSETESFFDNLDITDL